MRRIGEEQPGGWQFHLGDALGSVRQLAEASAAVTLAKAYEPFGSVLSSSGSAATAFQFIGEHVDRMGLVYLRARYYMPSIGAFISRDRSNGDTDAPYSFNRYAYVGNNPIRWTDRSGNVRDICELLSFEFDDVAECRTSILNMWNDEKTKPPYIHWDPAVHVPPATIYKNAKIGEEVASGTEFSQYWVCQCTGACGIVALAAIFRTSNPELSANELFDWARMQPNITPNYTVALELKLLVDEYPEWRATIYQNYINYASKKGFAYVVPFSEQDASARLRGGLRRGDYPIIGVRVNGSTGKIGANGPGVGTGHWVVVSGLSREWSKGHAWKWVRILNPFDNQPEYYRWDNVWSNWYLEVPRRHVMVVVERERMTTKESRLQP